MLRQLLACSLCCWLALGPVVSAAAAPLDLSSFDGTARTAARQVESLRETVLEVLDGKKTLKPAELKDLLQRVQAVAQTPGISGPDKEKLQKELDDIASVIDGVEKAPAAGPEAKDARAKLAHKLDPAGRRAKSSQGLEALAQDSSLAASVYDNNNNGARDVRPNDAGAVSGIVTGNNADKGFTFTSKPQRQVTKVAPPVTPKPQTPPKASVVTAATAALLDWVPDGAARSFAQRRKNNLAFLLNIGSQALPGEGDDLDHLVARADALLELYKKEHKLSDDDQAIMGLGQRNLNQARFINEVRKHRVMVYQAMKEDRIPLGLEMRWWELNMSGEPGARIKFSAQSVGGELFTGFTTYMADGTSKFEGHSHSNPDRGIVAIHNPKDNEDVQSIVDWDKNHEPKFIHTSIFDAKTGERIREELADMAAKLTRITTYKDGNIATETQQANDGRTYRDHMSGVQIVADKQGKAHLTLLPTFKGEKPFREQIGTLDEQGRLHITRTVLLDGKMIDVVNQRVNKILDENGKVLAYELSITDLATADDDTRAKLVDAAAKMMLDGLGMNDKGGRRQKALAAFLLDLRRYRIGDSPLRLTVDPDGTFRLIAQGADNTRRVFQGHFTSGSKYKNDSLGEVFAVDWEIVVKPDGTGTQENPGIRYEYGADGRRYEWTVKSWKDEYHGIKIWKADEMVYETYFTREHWERGGYKPSEESWLAKPVKRVDIEGSSTLGQVGHFIGNVPGIKQLNEGIGWGLDKIYDAAFVTSPLMMFGGAVSDRWQLEDAANKAKLLGNVSDHYVISEWLRKSTRDLLYQKIREDRENQIKNLDYRMSDQAAAKIKSAEITEHEAREFLVSHFGAGTYGQQLTDAGHPWLGTAVGITENVVKTLPLIIATWGAGELIGAARLAIGNETFWARMGLGALNTTTRLLTAAMLVPWAVNAADNFGKTGEAIFDVASGKRNWTVADNKQLTKTGTDAIFVGMMGYSMREGYRNAAETGAKLDAMRAKAEGPAAGPEVKVPDAPKVPDPVKVADTKIPDAPKVPEPPKLPDAPKVPDTPVMPEGPKVPDMAEGPKAPAEPVEAPKAEAPKPQPAPTGGFASKLGDFMSGLAEKVSARWENSRAGAGKDLAAKDIKPPSSIKENTSAGGGAKGEGGAKTEAGPKAEVKPEVKPEVKSEVKGDEVAKTEPKAETKADAKPDAKPDEVKSDAEKPGKEERPEEKRGLADKEGKLADERKPGEDGKGDESKGDEDAPAKKKGPYKRFKEALSYLPFVAVNPGSLHQKPYRDPGDGNGMEPPSKRDGTSPDGSEFALPPEPGAKNGPNGDNPPDNSEPDNSETTNSDGSSDDTRTRTNGGDDRRTTPTKPPKTDKKQTPAPTTTAGGGGGGSGGGSSSGSGVAAAAPSGGGDGGGGGGDGGGGGGGGGAGGGGGSSGGGDETPVATPGAAAGGSQRVVPPAPPFSASATGPSSPGTKRSAAELPPPPSDMGKHEPAPYARNPYDGSVAQKTASLEPGAPPKGVNSGGDGGMGQFKPSGKEFARRQRRGRGGKTTDGGLEQPADAPQSAVADGQTSAGEAEYGPNGELLAPAGFDYSGRGNTIPKSERPVDDKQWMLTLLLRVAAAGGVLALAGSDLPYLLGITRRRRKREEPAQSDTEQV